MSTIKPLDVYIGDVKVFPDINLDILKYFGTSPVLSDMADWGEAFFLYHRCDINNLAMNFVASQQTPLLLPVIDDSDAAMSSSAFHKSGASLEPGQYASSTSRNFWNFTDLSHYLWSIPFALNAAWLIDGGLFSNCEEITSIEFCGSTTPWTLKDTEGNVVLNTEGNFYRMFTSHKLQSVTGLVIGDTTYSYNSAYMQVGAAVIEAHGRWGDTYKNWMWDVFPNTYDSMFFECSSLTSLDVTWPTVMHGNSFDWMFYACISLPDNQFPTINAVPIDASKTITFSRSFAACNQLNHIPISASTWQYISNIDWMLDGSQVHMIDIPATATKLCSLQIVLGDVVPLKDAGDNPTSYSNNQHIIRTTSPMDYIKGRLPWPQEVTMIKWPSEYDPSYNRYLDSEHVGVEPVFDYTNAQCFTVELNGTTYTFSNANTDNDGYCWDDPVNKNVAIFKNNDTRFPDVFVKGSLSQDIYAVSLYSTAPAIPGSIEACMLFNYWDYDANELFLSTYGGLYVPDSQLSEWYDLISVDFNAANFADNCLHGLSELSS